MQVEMRQVRALRFVGPRPPMLRALIARMKEEEPSEAWRDRCYHNMRRVTRAMLDTDARPDDLRVALNAYLDGQVELASRWFTVDILLRPWGEH